jgi:hypothetical protein
MSISPFKKRLASVGIAAAAVATGFAASPASAAVIDTDAIAFVASGPVAFYPCSASNLLQQLNIDNVTWDVTGATTTARVKGCVTRPPKLTGLGVSEVRVQFRRADGTAIASRTFVCNSGLACRLDTSFSSTALRQVNVRVRSIDPTNASSSRTVFRGGA